MSAIVNVSTNCITSTETNEEKDYPELTANNLSSFLSSSVRSTSSKMKKYVSFAPGTYIPMEDNIALSITSHKYSKSVGHTQYQVEVIFRGIHWRLVKRYRDFESFHKDLCNEVIADSTINLPELPKKRWFERQRWLNRFDESYSRNRRMALQYYLRTILRSFTFNERRELFTNFLQVPQKALDLENEYRESIGRDRLEKELDNRAVFDEELRSRLQGNVIYRYDDDGDDYEDYIDGYISSYGVDPLSSRNSHSDAGESYRRYLLSMGSPDERVLVISDALRSQISSTSPALTGDKDDLREMSEALEGNGKEEQSSQPNPPSSSADLVHSQHAVSNQTADVVGDDVVQLHQEKDNEDDVEYDDGVPHIPMGEDSSSSDEEDKGEEESGERR